MSNSAMVATHALGACAERRVGSSLAWGTKIFDISNKVIYNKIEMKHMKPVILYSLPRTRSTAILYSCNRELKLNEPFARNPLHKNKNESWYRLAEYNSEVISSGRWNELLSQMNNTNTVTKILCADLFYFRKAREWIDNAINNDTHDIFVIERENREEILLSYILAITIGWYKTSEKEIYEFDASLWMLEHFNYIIDWYLRFYPKKGKIITFDNLPESHFDISFNQIKDQDSSSKYSYIKNLDEYRIHIKHILDYYKDEWDAKIKNLDQS